MKSQDHPASLWRPNRQELFSRLFHDLNQPLTSLSCSLELALLAPHNAEQTQEVLQEALTRIEQISHLTGCLHQLIEAGDPQDQSKPIDIAAVALQVIEELTPVAESLQIELSLTGIGLWLKCDHNRLRQALFHLVDSVLFCAKQRVSLILTSNRDKSSTLELTSLLKDMAANEVTEWEELLRSVALAAAFHMLEIVGAKVEVVQQGNYLAIRIHLPQTETATIESELPGSANISHSQPRS
jgi:hypothetical protein